jgi:hypothetical protein
MDTGYFLGVRWPGCDADHTPPSTAEVIKGWSYTSIHPLGPFRTVTRLLYIFTNIGLTNLSDREVQMRIIMKGNTLHETRLIKKTFEPDVTRRL